MKRVRQYASGPRGISWGIQTLAINEVKVGRPTPTNQDDGVFTTRRHVPGMVQLAGDNDIATHRQLVALLPEHDGDLACHHHHELIVGMPVQVEMGAGGKLRVVGNPARDWIGSLAGSLHPDRGTVAAPGWAPLDFVEVDGQGVEGGGLGVCVLVVVEGEADQQ
ncbi:MAG: hypothetical protein QGF90_12380 [Gammaproteobacteria bacterium]|nr:hypothetical protein [Gammaproteobacteria bacterium]